MHTGKTWAIVLADDSWSEAAGGKRHTEEATGSLRSVIGQLRGIVSRSRIYAIVDAAQPEHWRADVWALPASAVIPRPARQEASGACVLLALLAIERADPDAQVLIVPAGIPAMLLAALLAASANTLELARRRNCVVLLGDRQQGSADALGQGDIDLGQSIVAASAATLIDSYATLRPRSLAQLRRVLAPVRRAASPLPVGSLAPLLDSVTLESAADEMLVCCADRLHVLDISRDLTGHWDVPRMTGAPEAHRSPLQMIH